MEETPDLSKIFEIVNALKNTNSSETNRTIKPVKLSRTS